MRGVRGFTVIVGAATLAVAPSLAHCGGQSFVVYAGTVTEAADVAYYFDADGNPEGLPPIAGAQVSVCAEGECQSVSGDDGSFGPIAYTFPLVGGHRDIEVKFAADGYAPASYTVQYPTKEPTDGSKQLNMSLRRLAGSQPVAPGASP